MAGACLGCLGGGLWPRSAWAVEAAPPAHGRQVEFYEPLAGQRIRCFLCPFHCTLKDGETCFCRTRTNYGGKLFTDAYNNPAILSTDPIEKLPFNHYLPGAEVLTIACGGCNSRCLYCQNWENSQAFPNEIKTLELTPEQAVETALRKRVSAIAFGYTEPIVFLEYAKDIAVLARKRGLRVAVATSGFINPDPLIDFAQHVDAFVVSLKAFDDDLLARAAGRGGGAAWPAGEPSCRRQPGSPAMIEWTFFHKLLGIPERFTEPTHYHLLGIAPRACTPELVAQSLERRRKLLRQNLPGPQFIPLLLKFEKEVLEPAAETLSDPVKRGNYNDELHRVIHYRKKLARERIARLHMIASARQAIRAALGPGGVLEDELRPTLARQLCGLGIADDEVRAVLANIPGPALKTTPPEEPPRADLADLLDSPPEAVNESSEQPVAPPLACESVPPVPPPLPPPPPPDDEAAVAVEPVDVATEPVDIEVLDALPGRRIPRALERVAGAIIPLAAILAFTGFLVYYVRHIDVRQGALPSPESPTVTTLRPGSRPSPSVAAPRAAPKPAVDLSPRPGKSPSLPSPPRPPPPAPALPPAVVRRVAERVRARYSPESRPAALLGDVALTLRAIRGQADRLTSKPSNPPTSLDVLLASADPVAEMIQAAPDPARALPPPPAASPPPAQGDREAESRAALRSRLRGSRYQAIEQVRLQGTPAAAEMLLEALEDCSDQDLGTCSRIIRALRTIRAPGIPQRLIALLPASSPALAHLLTRTLVDEAGILPYPDSAALLRHDNTTEQRQESARWWSRKNQESGLGWGAAKLASSRPDSGEEEETDAASAWPRDRSVDRLVAVMARDAAAIAAALEQFRWEQPGESTSEAGRTSPPPGGGPEAEPDWPASMDAIVDQLGRLVREHPRARDYAVRAEIIEIQRKARTRASDTLLQRAAVCLDAIGELLDVLVCEVDQDKKLEAAMRGIQRRRAAEMLKAPDVLHEMRAGAHSALALWEYLGEARESRR